MKSHFEFTVNRKTWNRGRGGETSALLNERGMCCLGFAALACGYLEKDIDGVAHPEDLVTNIKDNNGDSPNIWFDGLLTDDEIAPSDIGLSIINTNDNVEIDDQRREEKLAELFAQLGVKVNFEG